MAALAPACERIAVAGSVRRGAAVVGDIEIVAIPCRAGGLFAQNGPSMLDPLLDSLLEDGKLRPGRARGERYQQFEVASCPGLMLDLFLVTPATWGVQFALRTGPADFSRALVTERRRGGRLQDGLLVRDGCVWRADQVMTGISTTAAPAGAARARPSSSCWQAPNH